MVCVVSKCLSHYGSKMFEAFCPLFDYETRGKDLAGLLAKFLSFKEFPKTFLVYFLTKQFFRLPKGNQEWPFQVQNGLVLPLTDTMDNIYIAYFLKGISVANRLIFCTFVSGSLIKSPSTEYIYGPLDTTYLCFVL